MPLFDQAKLKCAQHYNIDEQLFNEAVRLTGVKEKTALLRESLKALIQRESAHRLALLGASEQNLEQLPRRQPSK